MPHPTPMLGNPRYTEALAAMRCLASQTPSWDLAVDRATLERAEAGRRECVEKR